MPMIATLEQLRATAGKAGILIGCGLAAGVICWCVLKLVSRLARRADNQPVDVLTRRTAAPAGILLGMLAAWLALPATVADEDTRAMVAHGLSLAVIAAVAWLVVRLMRGFGEILRSHYRIDEADNLRARRVLTQMRVLGRVVGVLVVLLAAGAALMTFNRVRELGVSLLASAGVIGVVFGIAAQKTLGTFLAGIQIAITQPIRLDDVVIVEGQWGRIEEITLTYVVVRIWDLRRLVVPITYFIEKPFENWTRVTADLLGTAFLYVDYTVPVAEVRQELQRILEDTDKWDKKVWGLQVTNTTDRCVELRALMSAKDASTAWDLRCYVREKLVEFVQSNYPDALPRLRVEPPEQPPHESATNADAQP